MPMESNNHSYRMLLSIKLAMIILIPLFMTYLFEAWGSNDTKNLPLNNRYTEGINSSRFIEPVVEKFKSLYESPLKIFFYLVALYVLKIGLNQLKNKIKELFDKFQSKLSRYIGLAAKIMLIATGYLILATNAKTLVQDEIEIKIQEPRFLASSKVKFQEYGLIKILTPESYDYILSNDYDLLLVNNNSVFFAIDQLYYFDLKDISNPKLISIVNHKFNRLMVSKDGGYLFGLKGNGFSIFSISNDSHGIHEVSSNYSFTKHLYYFILSSSEDRLYLSSNEIYSFDITNLSNPVWKSTFSFPFNHTCMLINQEGTLLYAAGYNFLTISITNKDQLALVATTEAVSWNNFTDMRFYNDETELIARSAFNYPLYQVFIGNLLIITNLLTNPTAVYVSHYTDMRLMFYHGLYYSDKNDYFLFAGGSEGLISYVEGENKEDDKISTNLKTRNIYGFQMGKDETYMVILDETGLKTVRNIYQIYYQPSFDFFRRLEGAVLSSVQTFHIYASPSENYLFLYNNLDLDGQGDYKLNFLRLEGPFRFYFPFDETNLKVFGVIENLDNLGTFFISTDQGIKLLDPTTNTMLDYSPMTDIKHLKRFPSKSDFAGRFVNFFLIFSSDFSVIGFNVLDLPEGNLLPISDEIFYLVTADTLNIIDVSDYNAISLVSSIDLDSSYLDSQYSSGFLYLRALLWIDIFDVSNPLLPVKVGTYINPKADPTKNSMMAIREGFNFLYYFVDKTLFALNLTDKSSITESYSITLPQDYINMWLSSSEDQIYFMSSTQVIGMSLFQKKIASIDQTTFSLGTKVTKVVYLSELYDQKSYHYIGLDSDYHQPSFVSLYEQIYGPDETYQSFKDLPSWISFNQFTRELTFSPNSKSEIGDYTLYIGFAQRITTYDISLYVNDFDSQDVYSQLVQLDYLTHDGFMTSKFILQAINDLPSNMTGITSKINQLFLTKYSYTKHKISVVSSLNLDLSSSKLTIAALDTIRLNVQITLTNALFSPKTSFPQVFTQLSDDRTALILIGSRKAIENTFSLLSINVLEANVTTANLIINDFLNPTIEVELSNITSYIYVNNQPIFSGQFPSLKNVPIRKASYEIPYNLFKDENNRGDSVSYRIYSNNISSQGELLALPKFLTFESQRNILFSSPTLDDAVYFPENNTYVKDYPLTIIATSTSGMSASFNFTLRVKNEPPINFISISRQLADYKFYTGVTFVFNLNAETFIDFDEDTIEYTLQMEDEGEDVPAWITFKGLTLSGIAPQVLFGNYKFVVVASDGISSAKSGFSIQPYITFNFFLTVAYSYIGILLGATVLIARGIWLHKVLAVKHYRYPKQISIRVGEQITYEDLPPIAIVSDLQPRVEKVLEVIKKEKKIKLGDEVSSFIDQIDSVIESTDKLYPEVRLTPDKRKMLQLYVFYSLVSQRIKHKKNKKLLKIFAGLKKDWKTLVNIILEKNEEGFVRKFPKFEIDAVSFESIIKANNLAAKDEELVKEALVGYAYKNHVILESHSKLCFKYFQKLYFKGGFTFEREVKLKFFDFAIKALLKDELLTFSGKLAKPLDKKTMHFRIVRSTGILQDLIYKEIIFTFDRDEKCEILVSPKI